MIQIKCTKAANIPLLASPQGGVAERSIKCREASADREDGVVFFPLEQRKGKPTPAASASVAAQNRFYDAASPPCGDARRGIKAPQFVLPRSFRVNDRLIPFFELLPVPFHVTPVVQAQFEILSQFQTRRRASVFTQATKHAP